MSKEWGPIDPKRRDETEQEFLEGIAHLRSEYEQRRAFDEYAAKHSRKRDKPRHKQSKRFRIRFWRREK